MRAAREVQKSCETQIEEVKRAIEVAKADRIPSASSLPPPNLKMDSIRNSHLMYTVLSGDTHTEVGDLGSIEETIGGHGGRNERLR